MHAACPDCVETMKWSTPAFDYKGAMCGMAAFKAHCMFGFWKAPLVLGGSNPHRRFRNLRSVADLPSKKEMAALIHKAMALNDDGVVVARAARVKEGAWPACPPTLASALAKNKKARTAFDRLQPEPQARIRRVDHAKPSATRRGRSAFRRP